MKEMCKCGNKASHEVFKGGKKKCFCCKCYVQAGNSPADWHIECMREAGREKEVVAWGGRPIVEEIKNE